MSPASASSNDMSRQCLLGRSCNLEVQYCESGHLQIGVMEGVEELAALARQDIPERSTLGSTEGLPYSQNLLCPLQNLQATGLHQWYKSQNVD